MHRIRYPNILTLIDFIFFQMLILTITLLTDSFTKEKDSFKFGLMDVTLFSEFSTPFPLLGCALTGSFDNDFFL